MLAKLVLGITIALLLVPAAFAAGPANPINFAISPATVSSSSGGDFAVQFMLAPAAESFLPKTEVIFRPCDDLPQDLFTMTGHTRHLVLGHESIAPDKVGEVNYTFFGGPVTRPVYLKVNFAFKPMPFVGHGAAMTCLRTDVWVPGSSQHIWITQQLALG